MALCPVLIGGSVPIEKGRMHLKGKQSVTQEVIAFLQGEMVVALVTEKWTDAQSFGVLHR